MRALNMNELDYVSGGEGDANDDAGGSHVPGTPPGTGSGSNPVYPPFNPTEPWIDSDGNINYPP